MKKLKLIKRVVVIDDDDTQAEITCELIQEAGYKPEIFHNGTRDIVGIVAHVKTSADAAVCDHRLAERWAVPFNGAQLAASLMETGIPALLVSQYLKVDIDVSIRKWRSALPIVLRRNEASPDRIRTGLEECSRELAGKVSPRRRSRRALIRVVAVGPGTGEAVVDCFIPQWKPDVAVRFPLSQVPTDIQDQVQPQARLLANVNIGAADSDELFVENIELAPPIDEDDGLA